MATGAAFEGVSGKYVAEQSGPSGRRGARKGTFEVAESSRWSYDADAAARFWKRSKALTGAEWKTLGEEGVWVRHCMTAFMKQVLPRLARPAPTLRTAGQSMRMASRG